MADEPKIPKVVGDASTTRSLRLSAAEGFILSRIDGKASEKQLASLTGLSESIMRSSLEKLESLGVIAFVSPSQSPVPPPRSVNAAPPKGTASQPVGGPVVAGAGNTPVAPGEANQDPPEAANLAKRIVTAIAAIPADAVELSEDVDLTRPLRLRVLATCAVLESLDYYEILGIERTADKKAIKRAYFELASLFHPDRYFRKRLGSFKPRMETLFGRVTQVLDTLSSKELRAEYDEYLKDLDRTRAVEELMREAAAEAERAEVDALRNAGRASLPDITLPPSIPPAASGSAGGIRPGPVVVTPLPAAGGYPPDPRSTPEPQAGQASKHISGFYPAPRTPSPPSGRPSGGPPATPSQRAPGGLSVSDQARRDALAMRLLGQRTLSSRGMNAVSPSQPANARAAAASVPSNVDAGDALKRRYEERIQHARKAQGAKYIGLARESESKNDVVGAATAYKVALSFLSDDDPNLEIAKAAIAKAEGVLSETYLRQAVYEDRSEHWQDAARSWQRVIRGRPDDARAHERAAHALARSKGDLHVAAQLAQRAVQLAPDNPEYKITLATVFIEAGLMLNAKRELEAAAQLSPRNANIQALLKRVH